MDDNNKTQFNYNTSDDVTKTYKEVKIPIETKAEKTKRITVKCLIWFFSIILINAFIVVCNVFGITLGGIPIAIIYVLGFIGIKKLAKCWDEHCYYNTSLDEESGEQNQITEPTQISVEIPDTPKKTQETSLKDEKIALKNEYKEKLNILKSKNNKSQYKIATIILSVILAISLSVTTLLAINITQLNTELNTLKKQKQNLQHSLAVYQSSEEIEILKKIVNNEHYTKFDLLLLERYLDNCEVSYE